uniref:Integral membrane protein n=1 Tax=Streptomyces sp. NBC_01401 TaxID=2903854 RepID=A0AAU3GWR8_9ACTN
MEARDPELRRELDATLQARGELGPEYEPALIDSFLEKVEQRLSGTQDQRTRRHLAEQQLAAARSAARPARPAGGFGERFGFGVVSLVLAIPLSAIGVANAGIEGLVVAWLGIFGVNAVHAARTWPWARGKQRNASDWEG